MPMYMRGVDDLVERNRGFLTKHDRKYLRGRLDEMDDNTEHQKRYQIRERFRQAMLDFYFMSEYLSAEDKRLLWPEVDAWLWEARKRRQMYEDFDYPDVPFLIECWRDVIALFVECHTYSRIDEDELIARWAIENGVSKGIRKSAIRKLQRYVQVDASLNWGVGEGVKLMRYLNQIAVEMPKEPEAAWEHLRELVRRGYLTEAHAAYLYDTHVESSQ